MIWFLFFVFEALSVDMVFFLLRNHPVSLEVGEDPSCAAQTLFERRDSVLSTKQKLQEAAISGEQILAVLFFPFCFLSITHIL